MKNIQMKRLDGITCVFLDVGEVLLSDGWDHLTRRRAAKYFKLDWDEMEARHTLVFEVFEQGKISLDEYLTLVVFYKKQSFSRNQFRNYVFAQSKPYPEMIELIARLKIQLELKIVIVSNEVRELNAYRINKFKLNRLADCFISSCFVGMRKPDTDIFRLALDIAQVRPEQAVFIDNTGLFVQIATGMGIHGIVHTDYKSTHIQLSQLGLNVE
jgi:HAD superfamily hydrolase (TIGR01509 family)